MGVATVVASFVMCFFFNIILPSADEYSDVYLLKNTLTFNLGDSLQLSGCKVCHGVSEDLLYSKTSACDVCLTNNYHFCGSYPSVLKKLAILQNKQECDNETFVVRKSRNNDIIEFQNDACNRGDECCLQSFNTKLNDTISNLDPRLLIRCISLPKHMDFDFCSVTGKTSGENCFTLAHLDRASFIQQYNDLLKSDISMGGKKLLKNRFFTFRKVESSVVFENNFTFNDDKCGLYFQQKHKNLPLNRRCNQHSCLVHLQYLHRYTNMYDLRTWKKTTQYIVGVKVGGYSCTLLRVYGFAIFVPILLNLLSNIVMFMNDLRIQKANKLEVIPLLLLFYPQYKTLKFLLMFALYHQQEEILNRDKEDHARDVASLEPFLESSLQVKGFQSLQGHLLLEYNHMYID